MHGQQGRVAIAVPQLHECATSRHIDRKLFKMRELRGKGVVTVRYVTTDENPADLFAKVLSRQPSEKHHRTLMHITS